MNPIDFIVQFSRVISSSINPRTKSIQVDVAGIGSAIEADSDADETKGEVGEQSEMYGALGILGRPLSATGTDKQVADAVCIRTSDGLVPISWRDLRLNKAFPNGFPQGRIAMVGYGGGFHTIDLTDQLSGDQKSSIHFIYAPYEFSNGVPSKAMAICLDTTPGSENITMSIGGGEDGYQFTMNQADGLQVRTPDTGTCFNIRSDEILLTAKKIMLKGNVYVGSQCETGIPLLAGPASPPCPSLFVSPV